MAGAEEAVHGGCDCRPPFVGGKSVLLFGQVTGSLSLIKGVHVRSVRLSACV